MKYLDNLKRERSIDRVIFLCGMVLAFIGFLIPTVYVREAIPEETAVIEETASTTEEIAETSDELFDETEGYLDDTADNYLTDDEETVEDFLFTDSEVESRTSLKNIFSAAVYFNQSPTAYNATFLVIMWLCTIAGIALFFGTKTIVGDIISVLIGLAFGVASVIGIPTTLNDSFGFYANVYADAGIEVLPIVGYMFVGGYLVLVGYIVALVGAVLSMAHIQHPSMKK